MTVPPVPQLTRDQRIRAAELARAVVARVDPIQAETLEEDLVDYVRDPDLVLRRPLDRDHRGGFDLAEIGSGLATFALPVAIAAVQYLAGAAVEAVQQETRPRLIAWLRRLFHRGTPAAVPARLSPEQIDDVWQKVYENALALTGKDRKARTLANAVKGSLQPSSAGGRP
jgi:hypothetical protein